MEFSHSDSSPVSNETTSKPKLHMPTKNATLPSKRNFAQIPKKNTPLPSDQTCDKLGRITKSEDPSSLFRIEEILGKDSFGYVYRAVKIATNEVFAIKIITLVDDGIIEDLIHEISIFQEYENPNIVKYYASYVKDDNLWILMEYCAGGSVADICKILDNGLEEDQISLICREALKGLRYLHKMYKIHRDIKGGNILLTQGGQVRLVDFGLSAKLCNAFSNRNTFIGTPHWMAPEVVLEIECDCRADIWSLGIAAIEMAEMKPPHANMYPMRVLLMIPRSGKPKLKKKEHWSPEFHDFLSKCFNDLRDRPTAEQLLKHPFIADKKSKDILVNLVSLVQSIKNQKGAKLCPAIFYNDDEGQSIENENTLEFSGETLPQSNRHSSQKALESEISKGDLGIDKLQVIYRQDSTIRVPWLNLDYISPDCLLSQDDDPLIREVLVELSEGTPPTEYVNLNPSLVNLIKTYSYHRFKQDSVPATPSQVEETARIINELSLTLKTILRL